MEKPIFKKKPRIFTLRRWLWFFGTILMLFLGVLIFLPVAGEWGAENWLRNHGAKQAQIDDIDFNPFTGRFVLRGLQAGDSQGKQFRVASLSVDMDWWPLVRKRIYIEQVQLNGAVIDISKAQDSQWRLGEVLIPASSGDQADQTPETSKNATAIPWGVGVKAIQVHESNIGFIDAQVNSVVGIKNIILNNVVSWEPDASTSIDAAMSVDGGDFSFAGTATPFSEQPSVTGSVNLRQLDLQPYEKLLTANAVKKLKGKLSLDMKIDATMQSRNKSRIKANGGLALKDLAVELQDLDVQQQQLTWNGSVTLQIPAVDREPLVSVNGRLYADKSNIELPAQNIRVSQKSLVWSGEAAYATAPSTESSATDLTMKADAALSGLRVADTGKNLLLADFDNMELKAIRASTLKTLSLDRLLVKDAKFLQGAAQSDLQTSQSGERLGTLTELTAGNIIVTELDDVHMDNLKLSGLGVDITHEKDGQWRWIRELADDSRPPSENEDAGKNEETPQPIGDSNTDNKNSAGGGVVDSRKPASKPIYFSIGQLDVGGDSWVKYTDETVQPVYKALVQPLALSVKDINSADTQQASALELQAKMGEYTSVTASGKVFPFADKPTVDLVIKVSSFDVPQVSAFVPAYDIQRGRLYATVFLKLDQGKLDVNNDLRLSKLKMIAKTQGEAGLVQEGLTMPLDTALDLLRDNKDQIVIRIPITGDIEQPEFNLQSIINKATAKALQNAALAYVKHALQPLGTILLVANVAGKVTKPRFKPLLFGAGDGKLNHRATEYLNKIAGLLRDRPGLNLTFCGVATPEDKNFLLERARQSAQRKHQELKSQETQQNTKREKPGIKSSANGKNTPQNGAAPIPTISTETLLTMAKERGDAMKKYLTERKNISPDRLYACKPTVSNDDKSLPRVEITL